MINIIKENIKLLSIAKCFHIRIKFSDLVIKNIVVIFSNRNINLTFKVLLNIISSKNPKIIGMDKLNNEKAVFIYLHTFNFNTVIESLMISSKSKVNIFPYMSKDTYIEKYFKINEKVLSWKHGKSFNFKLIPNDRNKVARFVLKHKKCHLYIAGDLDGTYGRTERATFNGKKTHICTAPYRLSKLMDSKVFLLRPTYSNFKVVKIDIKEIKALNASSFVQEISNEMCSFSKEMFPYYTNFSNLIRFYER
jgi:lauroyl/myristoyl acyltransferase